jgi:hypothetical protein
MVSSIASRAFFLESDASIKPMVFPAIPLRA